VLHQFFDHRFRLLLLQISLLIRAIFYPIKLRERLITELAKVGLFNHSIWSNWWQSREWRWRRTSGR
jgi:hypothetical protein